MAVAALDAAEASGTVLLVAAGERRAAEAERALQGLAPNLQVLSFPPWDCLPYDRASPSPEVMGRRIAALDALSQEADHPRIVVTTAGALIQRLPPAEYVAEAKLHLAPGDALDIDAFSQTLRRIGYRLDERVDEAGEAAFRGQVIDVFPAGADKPLRIDHEEGAITAIRRYDPVTQLTIADMASATILPVSEHPITEVYSPGMEHRLPEAHDRLSTLVAMMPGAAIVMDVGAEERFSRAWAQVQDAYESRTQIPLERQSGPRPLKPEALYLSPDELAGILRGRTVTRFDANDPSAERVPRSADALVEQARAAFEAGRRVILAAADGRDLRSLVRTLGRRIDAEPHEVAGWRDALAQPSPSLLTLRADLGESFATEDAVVITARDALGRRARGAAGGSARPQEIAGTEIEMRVGDVIVHREHGLGILRGIETLHTEEAVTDLLRLEYHGEATLMVPVDDMGELWRYGASEENVTLDRLGGEAWPKRRAEVEAEIAAAAERLVTAVKARAETEAPVLVPPSKAYDRFVERFPFPETPDQLLAIDDCLRDLASGRPMNRLVCGDVGYGKTEVALRAAAAAALAGKQVVVVAPTTVLARQHAQTFERRFAGLGIAVAHLSRLTKPAEAKAIKAALADGTVQVVVGTHAVAGKGVTFKDLGLVVIDEEQRFGTAQKSRIQALGKGAHLLTLTATPIPRTLQAALVGLQDLSVLATPPARRQPIRTFLVPYDEAVVRDALRREQARGGQSFVVCPRVEEIAPMAERLKKLVPELQTFVAHGQMPAEEVDDAMVRFADGEGDVLLATNIIESGLDVPRANTMLVWRADRFGLAQLHQLRGRVGRGRMRGVAYLLTDPEQRIAKATRKRLETLETLDRLGAGFAISARDMDQRGAGDLFGEEQAGHSKLIGLGLYQHLMTRALADARGEPVADAAPVELNVGLRGFIPDDYVPDPEVRINLYARFAKLASADEVEALEDEIEDRFGTPPDPVLHLVALARLQQQARVVGVSRIDAGPQAIAVTLRNDPKGQRLERLGGRSTGAFETRNGRLIWAQPSEEGERIGLVAEMLHDLSG